MLRLRKFLKPFRFFIIIAIVLLFAQAICDLELPNLMSEIVNVGIQSSGIEDCVPEKIKENKLALLTENMPEEDKKLVYNSYIKSEDTIYSLKNNIQKEERQELNNIFENSIVKLNKLENLDDSSKTQSAIAYIKTIYDEVGVNVSSIQTKYILKTGGKMLLMSLLIIAIAISINYIATIVSKRLTRNLTIAVFKKVITFSDTEFDKFLTSSLITRTTNDINQVQNVVFMIIRVIAYAPIMGIGGLIMIIQRNANMTWILALGFIGILILMGVLFILAVPKFEVIQKLTDKINLVFREMLSGTMVARAFGTQKHEEEKFDKVNKKIFKTDRFITRVMIALMPSMTLIMNAVTVIIVWVGAHEIAQSNILVGDMMAFIQYSMLVIMSFLMFAGIFVMLPRAQVSAKRIADVLETEPVIKECQTPKDFVKEKMGEVEFKNVSFKYQDAEEYAIKDINFVSKPGQTTAFIGSTGSGKSTLIKLIPRFYDVTVGEVLVNGVNVKEILQEDLQKQIGYIPQTPSLLSGTIESNLKYGNINASDDLVEKAINAAQAIEFIEKSEDGIKSQISQSGKNISGGQKQRLAIARALIKESPIYIFDDSFSALDFKTDSKLRKALKEYSKNSNVLIVAQRIGTIMNADQIIVMEHGKIVGKGTHKELLKNCPTYYEIAASQLKKEELI